MNLAQLKALEIDCKEMYFRGTATHDEYAELKAFRVMIERALGVGQLCRERPETPSSDDSQQL